MRRRALAVLAVLGIVPLLLACLLEPPGGAYRVTTTAAWRAEYARAEACSGKTGDVERVEWYLVPGDSFECPSGRCAGEWQPPHRIYLAERWADDGMVVRHEALHELLGRGGHPDVPFVVPCRATWSTASSAMRGAI